MATVTLRGQEDHSATPATDGTFVSSTFTPGAGSMLVALKSVFNTESTITDSIADTFGGATGAWTQQVDAVDGGGGGGPGDIDSGVRIWTKLVGGTPASGAITVTRSDPTITAEDNGAYFIEIVPGAGETLSFAQAADTGDTTINTATLGPTFTTTPATTSVCVGGVNNDRSDAPGTGNITPPTGWTEAYDVSGAFGAHREAAYKIGSVVQNPLWGGLSTAVDGSIAGAVEIAVVMKLAKQVVVRQAVQRAAVR